MNALDERIMVISRAEIADAVYCTRVQAPQISSRALPGQFVQVRVGSGPTPLLRLPLSIAAADPAAGAIDLIYEVVGPKTEQLAAISQGEHLHCLGPLGRGFRAPRSGCRAVLVGGGVGVSPLLFLGQRVRAGGCTTVLLAGARTAGKLLPDALMTAACSHLVSSTDDGSRGHAGLVTELLDRELDQRGAAEVFSCGPRAMLRVVAESCRARGLACQVSLEEYMACGIGICMGCVVPVHRLRASDDYDRYRRVCVHGPVFDAVVIDWSQDG